MGVERPDLNQLAPAVRAYVEYLETELERLRLGRSGRTREHAVETDESDLEQIPLEPSEPETTLQVITLTAIGTAKRTPRHLYLRQRRAGMGIFDMEGKEDDPPAILVIADLGQSLLLFTNLGRAFRLPISAIPETPVRGRGVPVTARLPVFPDEKLVSALPDRARGTVAMVGERGTVRTLRHHVFGEYMKPGTSVFDIRLLGPLVSACWTEGGDEDLFIATRQGRAIRFPEKLVPPTGGAGIRLEEGDQPVAITAVEPESGVFLIGEDGRGTLRLMTGFNANKSAGGGGKIAINTDRLVAAFTVHEGEDIFAISTLSKIIRFMAAEVPGKEGVVQGVNCMMLRADRVVAAISSALP